MVRRPFVVFADPEEGASAARSVGEAMMMNSYNFILMRFICIRIPFRTIPNYFISLKREDGIFLVGGRLVELSKSLPDFSPIRAD